MDLSTLGVAVVIVLGIFTIATCVKKVPQGTAWIVERQGRYVRTLSPGLNFVISFLDRIAAKVSLMETTLAIPGHDVTFQYNETARVAAAVTFQVADAKKAAYQVYDLKNALIGLAQTCIRKAAATVNPNELLARRDHIGKLVLVEIARASEPWGVAIKRIELQDVGAPKPARGAAG